MKPRTLLAVFGLLGCRKEAPPTDGSPHAGETTPAAPVDARAAAAKEPEAARKDERPAEPSADDPPTPPTAIAGVVWGKPPSAADLPSTPVSSAAAGKTASIVHAVAGRLPGLDDSPLFLDLFTAKPPGPCALHVGSGAATSGYLFALGPEPVSGAVIEYHGDSELDARPPTYAKLNVRAPDGQSFRSFGNGDAVVIVDSIDRELVRGRVYAAFRDPDKSMVLGRFEAPICADADMQ